MRGFLTSSTGVFLRTGGQGAQGSFCGGKGSDDPEFFAYGTELGNHLVELCLFVGRHETCSEGFMARHDAWPDKRVDIDARVEKLFPEHHGFHLFADDDGYNGRAGGHEFEAFCRKTLADLVGIDNQHFDQLGFAFKDFQ